MAAVIIFFTVFSFSRGYLTPSLLCRTGVRRPQPALLGAGVVLGGLEVRLVAIGQVVGVLEGIAVGDHVEVEQAPGGGPDVGQRAAIPPLSTQIVSPSTTLITVNGP